MIGFGHACKKNQEIPIPIDGLAFAPDELLEKLEKPTIKSTDITSDELMDYHWLYYQMIYFYVKDFSWINVDRMSIPDSEKAKSIIHQRPKGNNVSILSTCCSFIIVIIILYFLILR